jgi:hypothetical protein
MKPWVKKSLYWIALVAGVIVGVLWATARVRSASGAVEVEEKYKEKIKDFEKTSTLTKEISDQKMAQAREEVVSESINAVIDRFTANFSG